LPEAQLDRFLCCLKLDYPSAIEEAKILHATTGPTLQPVERVCSDQQLIRLQRAVRCVHLPASVAEYAVRLVRATRPKETEATALVKRCAQWGAGPRASQSLVLVAKAMAALEGRLNCAVDDVAAAAHVVLRHRLILNYRAEADNLNADLVIDDLLKQVKK
jgi:MoxR-like ATPase